MRSIFRSVGLDWRLALASGLMLGAVGCGSDSEAGNEVPDSGDFCRVQAILQEHCVSCHDGNGAAGTPMGLTSYADLTADAPGFDGKKVYERVAFRIHPEKSQGADLSLMPPSGAVSEAELAAVDAWVAAGAPNASVDCAGGGDSGEGGASTKMENTDWPPPDCDEIYQIRAHAAGDPESPLAVTRDGEDDPNSHPQVYMDAPWGDEEVQAIAFLPVTDNAKILHHWILYDGAQNRGIGSGFLTGWAPGDDARSEFPDEVGMNLPSKLRLDMHYYNETGDVAYDQSGVDVCVVKGENRRKYPAGVTMALNKILFPGAAGGAMAPAMTANHAITGTCEVETTSPVTLLTASPHAHTYAVHTKFTLTKKDGSEVVMLDAPFQFGEQASYALDPPLVVETGDTITTTCVYSNQTTTNIYFGDGTDDEMCFNFAMYYPHGALKCKGALAGSF